jgi:hypothetical protein
VIYAKAFLVWLSFGVAAVSIGVLREVFLRPRLGELRAHQLGTLVGCAVIFAMIV